MRLLRALFELFERSMTVRLKRNQKVRNVPKTGVSMDTLSYDTNYDLLDANVQKSGEFATLAYDVETWRNITQPLATRIENVNP